MNNRLDSLLAALAAERSGADLSQVEALVWQRVAAREPTRVTWRWRAATAAFGLVMGVAVTGAGATSRPSADLNVFSVQVPQAPSSLLGLTQ